MARTYAQLQADIAAWTLRGDLGPQIPGWVAMCETDIAELVRARCMVARANQPLSGAFIGLPSNFLEIESIRDAETGRTLTLEDHYTGPLAPAGGTVTSYRLVGECIEFLPHPTVPASGTVPSVDMAYFAAPRALVDPQDSNAVLDKHYAIYLFGTLRYAGNYQVDAARMSGWEKDFIAAVTAANAWKLAAQYSGAPLRATTVAF